ncbi:uncharacterized protein G2W53_014807 [Senna tora]|uniref:Uncharacterized protein n=1 Tax=Senna tora TaxID=362788 RepID=A0A834WUE2_9FABA|nr:uncharacterized protein G2W53_014807 [Senna tora]
MVLEGWGVGTGGVGVGKRGEEEEWKSGEDVVGLWRMDVGGWGVRFGGLMEWVEGWKAFGLWKMEEWREKGGFGYGGLKGASKLLATASSRPHFEALLATASSRAQIIALCSLQ